MAENSLIQKLQNKTLYDYNIEKFKVIETHISWILLTGTFAYKIKKPVNLGFVDYSSLEKRKFYCEEEFRLNKLLAGELYLEVTPIYESNSTISFKKKGHVIEYAIKMKEFEQGSLFSALLKKNELTLGLLKKAAFLIATFHERTLHAAKQSNFGEPKSIEQNMSDNFRDCFVHLQEKLKDPIIEQLLELQTFSNEIFQKNIALFQERKAKGFIRECHGDLHLNNIVNFNDEVLIFDRIEFNPDFRFIDIMNDVAFLLMDLESKNAKELYFGFLNQYLEITGDYHGLALLDFYKIYRAMVRAKVALESLASSDLNAFSSFQFYLNYGVQFSKQKTKGPGLLVITHGYSGAGKSVFAETISPILSLIHLRSDIERKRLFKNDSIDSMYSSRMSQKTYQTLYDLAKMLLNYHYNVLVDATFLQAEFRKEFLKLAAMTNCTFVILDFQAPKEILAQRIENRRFDASEATRTVLEEQLHNQDPLTREELQYSIQINTTEEIDLEEIIKKINLL